MISQRLSRLRNVLIIGLPSVESFQVEFFSRPVIPRLDVSGVSEIKNRKFERVLKMTLLFH